MGIHDEFIESNFMNCLALKIHLPGTDLSRTCNKWLDHMEKMI